jgi:5'-3' exonuclease
LLRRFGTLEGIDSGLDGIQSEKLRKSLVENREAVFRNRKLIALKSDLPVPGLEQIDGAVPDRERLRALFAGWGFRSLLAELGPEPAGQGRLL